MSGTFLAVSGRLLWRLLDEEHINPAIVFREARLDPGLMDQSRGRYRVDRLIVAWRRADELIDNPCFGLGAARHWQPQDLHALGNDRILAKFLDELSGDDLITRVKAALTIELPSGNPDEEGIARSLQMSTRTLQRRLADSDTRYSLLLDSVRREMAEYYIHDPGRSLAEVSFLLGFSELSSFSRAFKRWTGESPSRYRALTD